MYLMGLHTSNLDKELIQFTIFIIVWAVLNSLHWSGIGGVVALYGREVSHLPSLYQDEINRGGGNTPAH